jgi:hypothetical protein
MVKRMAYLLELLGPADETRTRLRNILGWVGIGFLFLVGLVLPLVWVPYMAYSCRRSTIRMGRRARAYYGFEPGVVAQGRTAVQLGNAAGFVRMTLLILLPIAAAVVALLAGVSLGGGTLIGAFLILLAVSAVATIAWLGVRWWRHRRDPNYTVQSAS